MPVCVFIDGEAGTTGLEIRQRLEGRSDLELLKIAGDARKEKSARAALLNEADIAILCLPDEAAREAVRLMDSSSRTRVIDASTAHRVSDGWVYGFPEMSPRQRTRIAEARFVSNPGCYPTGMIALVRPLVKAGLLPADWPVTVHAVSGYSGGGRDMIAAFEDASGSAQGYRAYALSLQHKHIPEMRLFSGLTHVPLFTPAVGRYYRGMLVEVPLPLWALPSRPEVGALHETLGAAYEGCPFVDVIPQAQSLGLEHLDPESLNGSNRLQLYVFGNEKTGQARLVALLDNLGKGASGQAVQCLNIMTGAEEKTGLGR